MKVKLIDYGGRAPVRAHYNDAGADVFSPWSYFIEPGQNQVIPLGFGVEIPDGFAGLVLPRTSLAAKGITCNIPPIDAGYTGEIHAFICNTGSETYHINADDKIAQLVVIPVLYADFVTDKGITRKDRAFGSSGR